MFFDSLLPFYSLSLSLTCSNENPKKETFRFFKFLDVIFEIAWKNEDQETNQKTVFKMHLTSLL